MASGDEAKRPTAAQMLDGELAVNYNANDPAIFIKDSAGAIIRIAGNNSIGGDQDLGYTADGNNAGTVTITDGTNATIPIATNSVAGLFTGVEKQKLAGISAGAGVDQNLGYTPNNDLAGTVTITGGTDATIPIASYTDSTSVAGLFTGAEKKKLAELNTNSQNNTNFVQVVGDNMTGNLTLNTDKIVLNTDGTATFVGALTVTSTDVSAFTGKITTASTADTDPDTTVVTKDYLEDYTSENLWIDGGHASSNFGGAPAEIIGGKADTSFE